MQYMILIYGDEGARTPPTSEAEVAAMMEPWMTYTAEMQAAGVMVAGDALLPTATATTVRVRDGRTLHTDGPFAETREQLGGYYLINVPDLDAALKWAAKCPGAVYGSIEVRPVQVFS